MLAEPLPSWVAWMATLGGLGALSGLAAAGASLYLAKQNRRLLAAQATKAEAEGGSSMIASAIALTKALREEEETCQKRLAELSGRQEDGAKERAELKARIAEMERQIAWLEGLAKEAGSAVPPQAASHPPTRPAQP